MTTMRRLINSSLLAAGLLSGFPLGLQAQALKPVTASNPVVRERINIDKDWRFAYGHATDASQDFGYGLRPFFFAKAGYGDGPAAPGFNDKAWRKLDLPHDWVVELPFDARGNTNHGSKAVGRDFPQNSVGWYRKQIDIPAGDKGRRLRLEFDGAYRDSVVWVNGHYIGREASGYSSFGYDVTDYINYGGVNIIAVRIDATVEEGWFYEGGGIYRHVWLTKTDPLHVAKDGTFVSSEVKGDKADVTAQITVENNSRAGKSFEIEQKLYAPDGALVAQSKQSSLKIGADGRTEISGGLTVDKPALWSLETPQLYKLVTVVYEGGRLTDTYETPFGIRTVRFDANEGFFLNGKRVLLQGVNNHQDFAGIGVAISDSIEEYRFKRLKAIGVNAIRMSHNPPSPHLLDLADRLGFLIIDEHRMMGTAPEIRDQLERLIRRDRNHPSVILWSVGNEEWALEWNELGTRLADEMQWIVKQLDPTRRTTVATSGSGQGTSLAADVIGFNYRTQHDIDGFHKAHPEKPVVMTEEGSTMTTRGVYVSDADKVHLAAYDVQARPGLSSSIQEGWQSVLKRPFVAGMFVWTGFDYRGETSPFRWPAISSQFGMIDTTGEIKDTGYYLKSVWSEAPMVHQLPHWTGHKTGEKVDVWAYANTDEVELFLNGKSLGRKAMPKAGHLSWSVVYAPGTLSAKGYRAGKAVASTEVVTAGAPKTVVLAPEKTRLNADGTDTSVIAISLADVRGIAAPTADNLIEFETKGPIRIIGVGNGDPGSHEADRPAERHRYVGLKAWQIAGADSLDQGFDDPALKWRDPFLWLPPEKQPAPTKAFVIKGEFAKPDIAEGEAVRLFIADLASDQKVYLNGTVVTPKSVDGAMVLDVQASALMPNNSLTYVGSTPSTGIAGVIDKSHSGVNWGNLRITQPATAWQRKLFNGHAIVIVQSTGTKGQGVIIARSQGLKAAQTTLRLD